MHFIDIINKNALIICVTLKSNLTELNYNQVLEKEQKITFNLLIYANIYYFDNLNIIFKAK